MVTAGEIAEFVGGRVEEEDVRRRVITGVSGFAGAGAEALVFAQDDAALREALQCGAGLILASVGAQGDGRVVEVKDAKVAFTRVYAHWFDGRGRGRIHAKALIGAGVEMGEGCEVGAGAVIGEGVRMGMKCVIGAGVVVCAGTVLGDRVRVQAGAVLGSDGFGYVREGADYLGFPQVGTLWIGDDVEIGANTTIDRGALGETRIGRGTKIDNLVHIAHNCLIGEGVLIAAQVGMAGSTVIEDGAMLGGQVGLGERVTIGKGVILGGQGGVLPGKKIEGEGEIFWGTPARPVRAYLRDLVRLRRG